MNKAGLVNCYPCMLHVLNGLAASQIHDNKLGWNRGTADRITDFSLNNYFALVHVSNSQVATLLCVGVTVQLQKPKEKLNIWLHSKNLYMPSLIHEFKLECDCDCYYSYLVTKSCVIVVK